MRIFAVSFWAAVVSFSPAGAAEIETTNHEVRLAGEVRAMHVDVIAKAIADFIVEAHPPFLRLAVKDIRGDTAAIASVARMVRAARAAGLPVEVVQSGPCPDPACRILLDAAAY
jgi:predicted TIM-barrel fold metal-dependent hydrolase